MSRSAGINFGVPNSEYRLRIDPITGEAVSCYNQDTDTEYIGGGGGGGDSDFSTAKVTIKSSGNFNPDTIFIEMDLPVAPVLLPPTAGDMAGNISRYYLEDGEVTYNAILYKNACNFSIGNLENITVETSGNIESLAELGYKITGDCVIEFVGTYE